MRKSYVAAISLVLIAACSEVPDGQGTPDATTADAADAGIDADAGVFSATQVVFDFGKWTIPAGGEQYPCAQWTLGNEEPLYVNAVVQGNDGGFHHSNWYAVPDDQYEGPDGFFRCEDRNFQEESGAVLGEVVFAQSTQAYDETQRFPEEGIVIKIPPHSKIIGGLHLLNVSTSPLETGARMGLELTHPRDVETVVTPWRMDNSALSIPAGEEWRFSVDCDLSTQYENKAKEPFEPKIYWILPHYHGLGNYFRVDVLRPDGDETIVELSGFNAEANGVLFEPPIDLTGATGMRMVCGYYNPTEQLVTYGLEGDDEMCTLLAFTDAGMRLNTQVWENAGETTEDGLPTKVGDCSPLFIPKNEGQEMPTREEIEAPLYVPESNTADDPTSVVPECEDTPADAEPSGATTLSSLETDIFRAGCAYSSCHDADAPAAGLDFEAEDLHAELMEHELFSDVTMPLVTPGEPAESWLYRVMSRCEPETESGTTSPMPRNSPTLLDAGKVARVREWIAAGAADN
jgi:hypothetical protein